MSRTRDDDDRFAEYSTMKSNVLAVVVMQIVVLMAVVAAAKDVDRRGRLVVAHIPNDDDGFASNSRVVEWYQWRCRTQTRGKERQTIWCREG